MIRLFVLLLCALGLAGAEIQVIAPPGATVVGPYSPGLLTSDCLYISGQGALNAQGKIAGNVEQQLRDTLTNIRAIVEAAGLTMEHVVSTQLYLTDMSAYPRVDAVWREFFAKNPPARRVMGVHRMPVSTPVEVTAVAVRDLKRKKLVRLPGEPRGASVPAAVFAGERLYISGCFGLDARTGVVPPDAASEVRLALDRMARTLKAAGMDFRHLVLASPYTTRAIPVEELDGAYLRRIDTANPPARTAIAVDKLPGGANVEFAQHASGHFGEPLRLGGRYAVLLGHAGIHSRARRGNLRHFDRTPGKADHAKPSRRSGGGRTELLERGSHQRLPGQHRRILHHESRLRPIFHASQADSNHCPAPPGRGTESRRGRPLAQIGRGFVSGREVRGGM
jgi:2-iminobutanoate/2-iminopropanoate deaminase